MYRVTWQPLAESQLAEIWTAARDREAVTSAAAEIDRVLKRDAPKAGESRSGDTRILVTPPLVVHYDVNADQQTARVLTVHRIPQKPPKTG